MLIRACLPWVVGCSLLALSASAHAQPAFPEDVSTLSVAGEDMSSFGPVYINKRQCEGLDGTGQDSAEIRIAVRNLGEIASGADLLEFWMGSPAQSCQPAAGRAWRADNTRPCTPAATTQHTIGTIREVLTFRARDLFSTAGQASVVCDRNGPRTLYVVPLEHETPNELDIAPEGGIGPTLYFNFHVDTVPPPVVHGLRSESTLETAILAWDTPLPDPGHHFQVLFDHDAIDLANPGPCSSEVMRHGLELPNMLADACLRGESGLCAPEHATSSNHLNVDLSRLDLLPGEKIAASVVLVDRAGNPSAPSESICVVRPYVQHEGSIAVRKPCFEGCSLGPGEPSASSLAWLFGLFCVFGARVCARRRG